MGQYFFLIDKSEFVNSRAKAKSILEYPTEHNNMIIGSGNFRSGVRAFDGRYSLGRIYF